MRIYIDNMEIKNCVFDNTTKRNIIYTKDGIFCNHKNKLTYINIMNDTQEIIINNGNTFIIDFSKETYKDSINHIPYEHLYCEETYEKKHIGYDIFYIKHSYFDQIAHYFEVERLEDYMYDIMYSFLSIN
jgi:hypothetical protein